MIAELFALTLITNSQDATAPSLSDSERETIIAVIEALGGPCAFRVEMHEMMIPAGDPALALEDGRQLSDAGTRGADGSLAARMESMAAAYEAVAADFTSRHEEPTWRSLDFNVVDRGSEKLQRTSGELRAETEGQYRCPGFNLVYENYFGERQMLRAYPPGGSPLMYDLETVFSPLMIGESGASFLRRSEWEAVESADPGVLALRLAGEVASGTFTLMEVSRETYLPLAISWHRPARETGARLTAVFRYAPVAPDDSDARGQLFVAEVIAIDRDDEMLTLNRYRLNEVEFDVDRRALELHVLDGTMFYDERASDAKYYGMLREDWPAELSSNLVVHPELPSPNLRAAAEQREHEAEHDHSGESPTAETSTTQRWLASSLPWIGGGLIAVGVLGLLANSRRRAGQRS